MFDWLWDYFWFWTIGWWIIMIVVVPFLILLSHLSTWGWRRHPRARQWIARNLDI